MKSFAKKFLSLALAAVLLLGVFPMAAFAAEGEHTVTFYRNDEKTVIKTITVKHGDPVDPGDIPASVAPAYAAGPQKGWRYLKGENYYEGGAIVDNTNLVDDYDLQKFTVNFYQDDEVTLIKSEEVEAGKSVTLPASVKPANGDKHLGWRYLKGTNYYGGEGITSVTNLVDDWSLIVEVPVPEYTVTFYGNDEKTVLHTMTVKEGTVLNSSDFPTVVKPSNAGQWLGWRYLKGTNYYEGQYINADTNLVADFAELEPAVVYDVTLVDANGKAVKTVSGTTTLSSAQLNSLKDIAKTWAPEGYELDELQDTRNNAVINTNTVLDRDIIVKATFRKIEGFNPRPDGPRYLYKITFDENLPGEYRNDTKTTYDVKEDQRLGTLFGKGLLPLPSCNRYVFKGWYLCDAKGNMTDNLITEETLYTWDRDVTVKAKWAEEARVKLMIFRNGNIDNAVAPVQLYGYAVGDVIYTKDLKIEDYYKNGGRPFKWEGWFDREGWTYFRAKEDARPVTSIKTVGLDGTTTLFAMVYDESAPSNKKPDNTNPKTGDESMILATTAVMLVSAGALAVFFMDRKRRNG